MGEPKGLKGQVAVIVGGGSDAGRHMALALAARGVSVVVTGPNERTLGLTVGEIVYGAGKARHLPGDINDAATLDAAAAKARDVFGRLDLLIAVAEGTTLASLEPLRVTFGSETARDRSLSRIAVLDALALEGVVEAWEPTAKALNDGSIGVDAVVIRGTDPDQALDAATDQLVALASRERAFRLPDASPSPVGA